MGNMTHARCGRPCACRTGVQPAARPPSAVHACQACRCACCRGAVPQCGSSVSHQPARLPAAGPGQERNRAGPWQIARRAQLAARASAAARRSQPARLPAPCLLPCQPAPAPAPAPAPVQFMMEGQRFKTDWTEAAMADFHLQAMGKQLRQLRTALGLAVALNRTLIMPKVRPGVGQAGQGLVLCTTLRRITSKCCERRRASHLRWRLRAPMPSLPPSLPLPPASSCRGATVIGGRPNSARCPAPSRRGCRLWRPWTMCWVSGEGEARVGGKADARALGPCRDACPSLDAPPASVSCALILPACAAASASGCPPCCRALPLHRPAQPDAGCRLSRV